MIRVGGGWDTLEHYLDKHDPCRCGFSGKNICGVKITCTIINQKQTLTHRNSVRNTYINASIYVYALNMYLKNLLKKKKGGGNCSLYEPTHHNKLGFTHSALNSTPHS